MRRSTEAEDPNGRTSGLHDEAIPARYPSVVQPVDDGETQTVIGSRFPLRPGLAMPPGRGVLLADRTPVIIQVGVGSTTLQTAAATAPGGQARGSLTRQPRFRTLTASS